MKVKEPAPCCGASNETLFIWPSPAAHTFMDIFDQQNLRNRDQQLIAIVFLSAVFELLLEEVLAVMIRSISRSTNLTEVLLDGYRGKDRRIQLFNGISKHKISTILRRKDNLSFLDDWQKLSSARNRLVHGHYATDKLDSFPPIKRIRGNLWGVFADIHNDLVDQLRSKQILESLR